jgi:hypothetical protein
MLRIISENRAGFTVSRCSYGILLLIITTVKDSCQIFFADNDIGYRSTVKVIPLVGGFPASLAHLRNYESQSIIVVGAFSAQVGIMYQASG